MENFIEIQRYNVKGELISRREVSVTETEWEAINHVDYLQFDACGILFSEFDVYDPRTQVAMQSYSKYAHKPQRNVYEPL